MNILPYILFWMVGRVLGADKPNSCTNSTSAEKGICLSELLCVGIRGMNIGMCASSVNNVCCKDPKEYILKPVTNNPQNTFSPQKSTEEDFPSNRKLHGISILQSLVNGKESRLSKSLTRHESLDHRNPTYRNPVQTDSTFNMQEYVHIDSTHSPPKQVLTGLKLKNQKIGKGTITLEFGRPLLKTLDHDLRNPVPIQSTSDLRKPVQTDISFYLQKPVQVDPSHDLRSVVKVSDSQDLSRSSIQESSYDLRNPDKVRTANSPRESVESDYIFHIREPVQDDLSHDLRNAVKISDAHDLRWQPIQESDHDLRKPVKVHATNDLRKPVQTDSNFYLQKPVQIDSNFYLQKPVKTDPTHSLRKTVKISDLHDLRRQVIQESDHDLRKPVKVHATFDLRKPVQTESTFYLQKPVQVDPSHDLRKPVKVHATFDLRKPVQTDSTFYLQKPVQVDPSHNLRKPVKIANSHDLRWPVVQEPDHDLRNPIDDGDYDPIEDFFKSENAEMKLDKILQDYAKKTSKDSRQNQKNYDPIYELLHEDNYIISNCEHDYWSVNSSTSDDKTRLENWNTKISQQKVLFKNSTKECGIPYNDSSENLDFQKKNSNIGPWMVSVQEYFFGQFKHKCGGSLLNNLWVITAAHCVDLRPKWDFLLKLGTEIKWESENYIDRLVNKISIHPKYNNINFDNDVALLRMELPVTFQLNVLPICLPDIHEIMEKRKAAVFGWQVATRRKMSSGAAQAETVPVLTNKECEVMFSETGVNESIEKNFVCAGTRSVKESCAGDSGGPLAVLDSKGRWSLAGLYSWGKTYKSPNQPEVYISVRSYVNWIEDTIACFEHYINLIRITT